MGWWGSLRQKLHGAASKWTHADACAGRCVLTIDNGCVCIGASACRGYLCSGQALSGTLGGVCCVSVLARSSCYPVPGLCVCGGIYLWCRHSTLFEAVLQDRVGCEATARGFAYVHLPMHMPHMLSALVSFSACCCCQRHSALWSPGPGCVALSSAQACALPTPFEIHVVARQQSEHAEIWHAPVLAIVSL